MRDELDINTEFVDFRRTKSTLKVNQRLNSVVFNKKNLNIILNFLIYSLTFSSFYFIFYNNFRIDNEYLISTGIFLLSIFFGSSLSGKLKLERQDKSERIVKTLYTSLFITLSFLIILFLTLEINRITRISILSAAISGLVIELLYFILLNKTRQNKGSYLKQTKLPIGYILLDGLLLTIFCYFEIAQKIVPFHYNKTEFLLLALILLSWVISASVTHKFSPPEVSTSRMNAFELQVKFYLRIIFLTILSMVLLQIEFSNALNFIKALAGYAFISSLLSIILFARKINNKSDEATVVFLKAYEMNDTANRSNGGNRKGRYTYNNPQSETLIQQNKIEFEYLKEYGNVFSILDTILDLKSFDSRQALILKSDQPEDITSQRPNSLQLVVNLHVLNDQIKINDYLLNVRSVLHEKGVFVGALLPHHYRYRRYLKKYSFYVGNIFYFFDFMWKRVMPKIPFTREIYSTFSKEKDRAISLAEGLGRLVYCGFNIINLAAVDDVVYFAAVKEGVPNTENKFFYSPIFKMNRIGKNGREIKVYKLRTMYPYAEYLQDYIVRLNGYSKIGKPANDFRLPVWGNFFRKYWIDELPQLLNVFKGEMKLVGARPLSKKVYNDYPADLKKLRNKYKPGCIPPYVSLMMQSMEKSIEAERIYLNEKEKHPIITEFKYFFNALYNILSRKIRSS